MDQHLTGRNHRHEGRNKYGRGLSLAGKGPDAAPKRGATAHHHGEAIEDFPEVPACLRLDADTHSKEVTLGGADALGKVCQSVAELLAVDRFIDDETYKPGLGVYDRSRQGAR